MLRAEFGQIISGLHNRKNKVQFIQFRSSHIIIEPEAHKDHRERSGYA